MCFESITVVGVIIFFLIFISTASFLLSLQLRFFSSKNKKQNQKKNHKMDDKFVLPAIPKIHVPSSTKADHKKLAAAKKSNKPESKKATIQLPPPKLCPSCSKVLLEYLIPLQQYINHVVTMTIEECGLKHVAQEVSASIPNLRIPIPKTDHAQSSGSSTSIKNGAGHQDVATSSQSGQEPPEKVNHGDGRKPSPSRNSSRSKEETRWSQESAHRPESSGHRPSKGHSQESGSDERRSRSGSFPPLESNYVKHDQSSHHETHHGHQEVHQHDHEHHRDHGGHQNDLGHDAPRNQGHVDMPQHFEPRSWASVVSGSSPSHQNSGHQSQISMTGYEDHTVEDHRADVFDPRPRSQSLNQVLAKSHQQDGQTGHHGEHHGHQNVHQEPHHVHQEHRNVHHEQHNIHHEQHNVHPEQHNVHQHQDSNHEQEHYVPHHEPQTHGGHNVQVHHHEHHNVHRDSKAEELPNFGAADERHEIEEEEEESSFAFVTIIYNNLSAINAIILANSLIITRKSGHNIPFIVLLGGKIDSILRHALDSVFDEVINLVSDFRMNLVSNFTLGQQPLKFQLWNVLAHYKKCLFIESACLVVSDICHVFNEFQELSACVDWMFPDFFSPSVFVMEPNVQTYDQIVEFARQSNEGDGSRDFEEDIDEMIVLNQFFANKWNRVSFVYNFVPNTSAYTQIPAFLKFGGDVKIVNFGSTPMTSTGSQGAGSQPWHVMFDLSVSEPVTSNPINNYVKFYLSIFLKRLWPLLQQPLTPLLLKRIGRREWSVYELTRFLTSGSENDDIMYSPITLRRKEPSLLSVSHKIEEVDEKEEEEEKQVEEKKKEEKKEEPAIEKEEESKQQESDIQVEGEQQQLKDTKEKEEELKKKKEGEEESMESKMKAWDTGAIDWMGVHGSDKIIKRLMGIIK